MKDLKLLRSFVWGSKFNVLQRLFVDLATEDIVAHESSSPPYLHGIQNLDVLQNQDATVGRETNENPACKVPKITNF